jgi:hypothetical protein
MSKGYDDFHKNFKDWEGFGSGIMFRSDIKLLIDRCDVFRCCDDKLRKKAIE